MSSCLVLKRRDAVYLMTDAAAYLYPTGILTDVNLTKAISIPTLHAAVSSTGPATLGAFVGHQLARSCASFDDLVAHGNEIIPRLFSEYSDEYRQGDASGSFYLVGWSRLRSRPAAYCIELWSDRSSRHDGIVANSANGDDAQRFKLSEIIFAGSPLPGPDLLAAAGFQVPDDLDEVIDPARYLLHLLEIQRHERIEGKYWVGGKAVLTTVDREGIRQRVIHHWKEDQIGEVISPSPIDWSKWRMEHRSDGVGILAASPMNRKRRRALKASRQ